MCLRMAKGLWGPLLSIVALSMAGWWPTVCSCFDQGQLGVGFISVLLRNSLKPLSQVVKFQLLPVPAQEWVTGDQWPWLGTGHSGHCFGLVNS